MLSGAVTSAAGADAVDAGVVALRFAVRVAVTVRVLLMVLGLRKWVDECGEGGEKGGEISCPCGW